MSFREAVRFGEAVFLVLYCILAENFHLVYEYATNFDYLSRVVADKPALIEEWYTVVDYSMYSAKAMIAWWCFIWLHRIGLSKSAIAVLLILPAYYTLDCYSTLITGNYDGLVPMLICMGIALIVATYYHFNENYQIVRKTGRKKAGFV